MVSYCVKGTWSKLAPPHIFALGIGPPCPFIFAIKSLGIKIRQRSMNRSRLCHSISQVRHDSLVLPILSYCSTYMLVEDIIKSSPSEIEQICIQRVKYPFPIGKMAQQYGSTNSYFVPGYGISRAVIQSEIRYFSGPDSIVRPYTYQVRRIPAGEPMKSSTYCM